MESLDRMQLVRDFLARESLCVISTVSPFKKPQSALVAFSENQDLSLNIGTYKTARKHRNLQVFPSVSVVVGGFGELKITVQYEGEAREVLLEERDAAIGVHAAKNPGSLTYASHPDQTYYRIEPTWIRYSDFSGDRENIFEIKF